MSESTLSLTRDSLAQHIGFYLSLGRKGSVADGLTSAAATNVTAALDSGLREFYAAHDWSFLYPEASLTLFGPASGTVTGSGFAGGLTTVTATTAKFFSTMIGHSIVISTVGTFTITGYTSTTVITVSGNATCTSKSFTITPNGANRLPDDFGGILSNQINFTSSSGGRFIEVGGSIDQIRALLGAVTTQSRPYISCVSALSSDGTTGQRFDLVSYPICDTDYPVKFRYGINANALLTTQYPYGGEQHAETIRAYGLAAAEKTFNDGQTAKQAEAQRMLQLSIQKDNRSFRALKLGVAGDAEGYNPEEPERSYVSGVTVNGSTWG